MDKEDNVRPAKRFDIKHLKSCGSFNHKKEKNGTEQPCVRQSTSCITSDFNPVKAEDMGIPNECNDKKPKLERTKGSLEISSVFESETLLSKKQSSPSLTRYRAISERHSASFTKTGKKARICVEGFMTIQIKNFVEKQSASSNDASKLRKRVKFQNKAINIFSTHQKYWIYASSQDHAINIYQNEMKTSLLYQIYLSEARIEFQPNRSNAVTENCFCIIAKMWKKRSSIRCKPQIFVFSECSNSQPRVLEWVTCISKMIKATADEMYGDISGSDYEEDCVEIFPNDIASILSPPTSKPFHKKVLGYKIRNKSKTFKNCAARLNEALSPIKAGQQRTEAFLEKARIGFYCNNSNLKSLPTKLTPKQSETGTKDPETHIPNIMVQEKAVSQRVEKSDSNFPGISVSIMKWVSTLQKIERVFVPVIFAIVLIAGKLECSIAWAISASGVFSYFSVGQNRDANCSQTYLLKFESSVILFSLVFIISKYGGIAGVLMNLGLFISWTASLNKMDCLLRRRNLVRNTQHFNESNNFNDIDFPNWMKFPGIANRTPWLNEILKIWWPFLKVASQNSIVEALNPILQECKPAYLQLLEFSRVEFGDLSPTISGVQVLPSITKSPEIILDVEVQYAASLNQIIEIRMVSLVGVSAKVRVKELVISGTVRLAFRPLISEWPCMSALSISFISKPTIDFSLTAAKLNINSVPFASEWLHTFLSETLIENIVYPKFIEIPFWDDELESTFSSTVQDPGVVSIEVLGVNFPILKRKDEFSYCTVNLLQGSVHMMQERTVWSSSQKEKNANFSIYFTNLAEQSLLFEFWNENQTKLSESLQQISIFNKEKDHTFNLICSGTETVTTEVSIQSSIFQPNDITLHAKQQDNQNLSKYKSNSIPNNSGFFLIILEQIFDIDFKAGDMCVVYISCEKEGERHSLQHNSTLRQLEINMKNKFWFLVQLPQLSSVDIEIFNDHEENMERHSKLSIPIRDIHKQLDTSAKTCSILYDLESSWTNSEVNTEKETLQRPGKIQFTSQWIPIFSMYK